MPVRIFTLRLLEDEEKWKQQKAKALIAALEEGEASGVAQEIDFEELLVKFKADRAARLQHDGKA